MRHLAATALAALAVAACSGGSTTTTTEAEPTQVGAGTPMEAVTEWIDALLADDADVLGRLVSDEQLAVLIALDNALDGRSIAQLVRGGISDELRIDYWRSFAAGFDEFGGAALSELAPQGEERFVAADTQFAAVEVAFATRLGGTEIVTVQLADGSWQVDLVATIGPSLVRPLRSALAAVPDGEDGVVVKGLLETTVVPSLLAALQRPAVADLPADFVLETESLVKLLSQN